MRYLYHKFAFIVWLVYFLLNGNEGSIFERQTESWTGSPPEADYLKEWYKNATWETVSRLKTEARNGALQSFDLKTIYCEKISKDNETIQMDCRQLMKCLTEADALEVLQTCLHRVRPSFRAWRKRSPYIAPELVPALVDILDVKPGSALEFGSRVGSYLMDYSVHGVDVCVGIEQPMMGGLAWYSDEFQAQSGPIQLPLKIPKQEDDFDRLKQRLLSSSQTCFDIVQSLEVMQHVPRADHCPILNFLAKQTCNWVVTSISHIGQGGHNHIANRAQHDFQEEWLQRGFAFQPNITARLRQMMRQKWLRTNLLVFKASGEVRARDCDIDEMFWFPYEDFTSGRIVSSISPIQQVQQPILLHQTSLNTAPGGVSSSLMVLQNVYLLTTIPSNVKLDKTLLRMFVQHYVSLGITPRNFLVVVQGVEASSVSDMSTWLKEIGVKFIRAWVGQFDSRRKILEYIVLQEEAGVTEATQWIVLADCDELHEFRSPLPVLINYLEKKKLKGLTAYFADRVTYTGVIPPQMRDNQSLLTQFPLVCRITKNVVQGYDWKVVIFQAVVRSENHRVIGKQACHMLVKTARFKLHRLQRKKLCSNISDVAKNPKIFQDVADYGKAKVVVHHFKWVGAVTKTLRERVHRYKKIGLGWYKQSERLLKYIQHEDGGYLPTRNCLFVNGTPFTSESYAADAPQGGRRTHK